MSVADSDAFSCPTCEGSGTLHEVWMAGEWVRVWGEYVSLFREDVAKRAVPCESCEGEGRMLIGKAFAAHQPRPQVPLDLLDRDQARACISDRVNDYFDDSMHAFLVTARDALLDADHNERVRWRGELVKLTQRLADEAAILPGQTMTVPQCAVVAGMVLSYDNDDGDGDADAEPAAPSPAEEHA